MAKLNTSPQGVYRVDKDVIGHKCKKPGHLLQHSAQKVATEAEEVIVVVIVVVPQEQVEDEESNEVQLLHSMRSHEHTKEPTITAELKVAVAWSAWRWTLVPPLL